MNPFDDDRLHGARSALVNMTPDDQGRFDYELMCQYTRLGLDALQVGDLVGVENFTPNSNGKKVYSVLTINQVYPVHYAAQGSNAYPGHEFESMRAIKEDWESQEDKPLHLTTTIKIKAVSTGYQFELDVRNDEHLPSLQEERNLPMIGAQIRPLSLDMVDAIVNQGLEKQPDSPLSHKKFEELNIKLDQESLLTTHFGIFGFTGVGKSNLVSSLVSSLCFENPTPLSNFIIMDPNDEYLGLFIDRGIIKSDEITYIHIGSDSLHEEILTNLGNPLKEIDQDVIDIMRRQLRLPSVLLEKSQGNANFSKAINDGLRNIIQRTRIMLPFEDVAEIITEFVKNQIDKNTGPEVRTTINSILMAWTDPYIGRSVNSEEILKAIEFVNSEDNLKSISDLNTAAKETNARGIINRAKTQLKQEATRLSQIPSEGILQINELINRISDSDKRQTVIITGRRDSELKRFVAILGNKIYDRRRKDPNRTPFIIFMFDEADLFIPQSGLDDETMEVRELCVTLARRGRKFGLGIGIATQRSSLLDTEVMSNLHTYFVSKLPRVEDRKRVAEAFGISEEQLAPTFTFSKGNWLVISHDATGLKGVPIPTKAVDANERIKNISKGGYSNNNKQGD